MSNLKMTLDEAVQALNRLNRLNRWELATTERLAYDLKTEVERLRNDLTEAAVTLPKLPAAATDLVLQAAVVLSKEVEMLPGCAPDRPVELREVLFHLSSRESLSLMGFDSRVPVPAGKYRALFFLVPVKE